MKIWKKETCMCLKQNSLTCEHRVTFDYYYLNKEEAEQKLKEESKGAWKISVSDYEKAKKICMKMVEEGVVLEAKHTNKAVFDMQGFCSCYFFDNYDNTIMHARILTYLIQKGLVSKNPCRRNEEVKYEMNDMAQDKFFARIYPNNFV